MTAILVTTVLISQSGTPLHRVSYSEPAGNALVYCRFGIQSFVPPILVLSFTEKHNDAPEALSLSSWFFATASFLR